MEKTKEELEKERHIFHILLAILITCLFFIILNFGIPIKVLVLIVFSIILTFGTVFFCVWCLRILEEKRIIELSRKEQDVEKQRGLLVSRKSDKNKYKATASGHSPSRANRSAEPPTIVISDHDEIIAQEKQKVIPLEPNN